MDDGYLRLLWPNRWILTKLRIERLEPVLKIEGMWEGVWPILGVGDHDITKNGRFMTLLGKKDYGLTKNIITATILLFVTRPTRFWQAPHSAQGTTKPGKTWSGELFFSISRKCELLIFFHFQERVGNPDTEAEGGARSPGGHQSGQQEKSRECDRHAAPTPSGSHHMKHTFTSSGSHQIKHTWTCDVGKSVIFLWVPTKTAAFIYSFIIGGAGQSN